MPARSLLLKLLVAAVVSSAIHYTDNTVSIEEFPGPSFITPATVVLGWLFYTPFALAGYHFYGRGRVSEAAVCLAIYSISGLISIGHYLYATPGEIGFLHELTIFTDIILGAAVLSFAVVATTSARRMSRAT